MFGLVKPVGVWPTELGHRKDGRVAAVVDGCRFTPSRQLGREGVNLRSSFHSCPS